MSNFSDILPNGYIHIPRSEFSDKMKELIIRELFDTSDADLISFSITLLSDIDTIGLFNLILKHNRIDLLKTLLERDNLQDLHNFNEFDFSFMTLSSKCEDFSFSSSHDFTCHYILSE